MRAYVNEVGISGPTNGAGRSNAPAPRNGSGRVRQYEELDGGQGRGVFFRPQRHSAADLAPLRGVVTVSIAGASRECALLDVSQNGVAFVWPPGVPPRPGEYLELLLRFDGHEAFRGATHIGSVREQDGSTFVGVSFDDFLLDIDEVLELRNVRRWQAEFPAPPVREKPWYVLGGERFKALVAELRAYFEDAEHELDELEKQLPWHVLQGSSNPARTALISHLRTGFVTESVRLMEAIDDAVRELRNGHANPTTMEWSRRHLDPCFMQSPGCQRARNKPFGYPGDYEVMNFIYERHFEGQTLFARAVHLSFAYTRASVAVRCRKDLLKREIKALLTQRAASGPPLRILSLAAGPAQEWFELLAEVDELPAPVEVVLFDQDKNALAHAWRRLKPSVDGRFSGAVRLTFLHDSIKRLLRDAALFDSFPKFDFVYSCGLLDYLQYRTAVVLARRLSLATAPGGRLLLANMVDHPTRWLMEHHMEWELIYRTREQLLELGRQAVPDARIRIFEEESGVNPFLEMVRE